MGAEQANKVTAQNGEGGSRIVETEPNEKKPMQEKALMYLRHFGISGVRKTLRTSTTVYESFFQETNLLIYPN